jgi:MoCo/4Fe-4S cofactor protein with predicted Tat translocation signal
MNGDNHLDLAAVRDRLSAAKGKHYWRTLDEIAATPQFEQLLHREFPRLASEWNDPVGRRNFLKMMGASLAFAGLSACSSPPLQTIVPYSTAPEQIIPGQPLFFATAMSLAGCARWRATRTIRAAWAPPTCSPRPPYWVFMTRTAPKR